MELKLTAIHVSVIAVVVINMFGCQIVKYRLKPNNNRSINKNSRKESLENNA